jgi:hypothetical protein
MEDARALFVPETALGLARLAPGVEIGRFDRIALDPPVIKVHRTRDVVTRKASRLAEVDDHHVLFSQMVLEFLGLDK